VSELAFDRLVEVIHDAEVSYHKLVIVAGPSGSGKTGLLTSIARQLKMPLVNLSLLMSQRLLSLTKRQRRFQALEAARELIDEQNQASVCLDNTELLFDSALSLNPLQFLQDISRNRLIVSSWNGTIDHGALTFGYPGHPDFFKESIKGYPVVSISEDKIYLHLTS
jgi:hypothetical protein